MIVLARLRHVAAQLGTVTIGKTRGQVCGTACQAPSAREWTTELADHSAIRS